MRLSHMEEAERLSARLHYVNSVLNVLADGSVPITIGRGITLDPLHASVVKPIMTRNFKMDREALRQQLTNMGVDVDR